LSTQQEYTPFYVQYLDELMFSGYRPGTTSNNYC